MSRYRVSLLSDEQLQSLPLARLKAYRKKLKFIYRCERFGGNDVKRIQKIFTRDPKFDLLYELGRRLTKTRLLIREKEFEVGT